MKVRTRFAPSPTGSPHIGHLRTAVYAYALAKHNSGDFILRIEDTDQQRYVLKAVESIKDMLTNFGMKWDEYYVQSERTKQGVYALAAKKLVKAGHAFYCNCPPRNAKKEGYSQILRDPCREKNLTSGAIKIKVPDNQKISYTDFIFREEISWDSNKIFDATLLKTDEFPTYHLAVVVDDHGMKISHALRGYDWMSSTPLHLLLYQFFGYETPQIGHLTDIQSPEGGKLSKRKGSTSIEQFLKEGYLPEALLNFVILLGWAPKDNREMFTLAEFVQNFNPNGFQKSNPKFLPDKLNWFNQQYIKKLSDGELTEKLKSFTDKKDFEKLIPLIRDRLVRLKDFDSLTDYFFSKSNQPNARAESWLNPMVLEHAVNILEKDFDGRILETEARKFCTEKNIKVGDYFMALRVAITGRTATPPLWEVMKILGKEETLKRLWLPKDKN